MSQQPPISDSDASTTTHVQSPEVTTVPDAGTTHVQSSVVIIGRDVNQSIFSPVWLFKQGILLEEEITPEKSIFVAGLTRVETSVFEFMVLPDRIQLKFSTSTEESVAVLTRVILGATRTLPHTPFTAIGMNFEHKLVPTDANGFAEWNRKMLACPWAVSQVKGEPRDRFGCSFAYDAYGGARMRVRVAVLAQPAQAAPALPTESNIVPYAVNLHCNLHRDLQGTDSLKEMPRMLSFWKQAQDESFRLARSLMK
jgi:hypothetical protein